MKTKLNDFKYCAGYSPDGGKTQYAIIARSMEDLHFAWENQPGQITKMDERKVMEIEFKSATPVKP